MRALLDVNVLIALLDSAHVYHDSAMSWLEREIHHGWASCPITQIGCVRIMSHPSYPGTLPLREVATRLGEAINSPEHEFWPVRGGRTPHSPARLRRAGPRKLTVNSND